MTPLICDSISLEPDDYDDSDLTPLLSSSSRDDSAAVATHAPSYQRQQTDEQKSPALEGDIGASKKGLNMPDSRNYSKSCSSSPTNQQNSADDQDSSYLGCDHQQTKPSCCPTSTNRSSSCSSHDLTQYSEGIIGALPSESTVAHKVADNDQESQTVTQTPRGARSRFNDRIFVVFNAFENGYKRMQTDPEEKVALKEAKRKRIADAMKMDFRYLGYDTSYDDDYYGAYPNVTDWKVSMSLMMC